MVLEQKDCALEALKGDDVASRECFIIASHAMPIETIILRMGGLTLGHTLFNVYLPETVWFRFTLLE
ncbi:MAG: hypothetical protein ABI045_06835 [Flavobacteriales bacterium]